MIVVDSSVWINFLRDRPTTAVAKLDELRRASRIVVGDIVLFEVLQGARDQHHADTIERLMRRFTTASMLGPELAVKAALNSRLLRARGATVRKWADLVIGTFAVENGYELLHEDRDYDVMQQHLGLKVH